VDQEQFLTSDCVLGGATANPLSNGKGGSCAWVDRPANTETGARKRAPCTAAMNGYALYIVAACQSRSLMCSDRPSLKSGNNVRNEKQASAVSLGNALQERGLI